MVGELGDRVCDAMRNDLNDYAFIQLILFLCIVAQKQIRALIPKLIEGGDSSGRVVLPMYKTVQNIIFSATMHSLLSPLLSCPDVLENFEIFDKKFSRFLGGVPSIFLSGAVNARENILKVLMDPNFLHNQTQFLNVGTKIK